MAGQLLVSQPWGCETRLRGRTAIPSEFAAQGSAREVTDLAPDEVAATAGRAAPPVAPPGLAVGPGAVPGLIPVGPGGRPMVGGRARGLGWVSGGGEVAAAGGGAS